MAGEPPPLSSEMKMHGALFQFRLYAFNTSLQLLITYLQHVMSVSWILRHPVSLLVVRLEIQFCSFRMCSLHLFL